MTILLLHERPMNKMTQFAGETGAHTRVCSAAVVAGAKRNLKFRVTTLRTSTAVESSNTVQQTGFIFWVGDST